MPRAAIEKTAITESAGGWAIGMADEEGAASANGALGAASMAESAALSDVTIPGIVGIETEIAGTETGNEIVLRSANGNATLMVIGAAIGAMNLDAAPAGSGARVETAATALKSAA
mmetsp:Transcript_19548/g.56048  ORF Transcript_19548/g.56048 Transcript_19548/m.56048 type:complete len:116 (+) Transcript_19548:52-399(+)